MLEGLGPSSQQKKAEGKEEEDNGEEKGNDDKKKSIWLYWVLGISTQGSHPCTSSSLPMEPSPRLEPSKVVLFPHPLPPPCSHVDCFSPCVKCI